MEFSNVRKNGLTAINLREEDELIEVKITDSSSEIFLVTKQGMCIRFQETDVRATGRASMGVIGMNLTFDDEIEEKPKKVKKVKKTKQPKNGKKLKLKKWHVFITVLVVLIVAFLLYIFVFSGNNKGPVYGQRCVKLLSVDQNTVSQVESQIEQDDRIQDLAVKVDCRTIKLTYQLVDNVSADDAKSLVEDSVHTLSLIHI